MLSIGKLGVGQEEYYLRSVARGVEDYYTGAGESPGVWVGDGARRLGLCGEVTGRDLRTVLGGVDPASGRRLVAGYDGRVPGFDLTFSAPKGVSLLYALAEPAVSGAVRAAHDAAVADAFGYLERAAGQGRRGHGGATLVEGRGFVAAGFVHRTSRAGDPHLHTHVLVANMVEGSDGRWGALFAQRIYRHAKTAGVLYQARLRDELARTLGVELVPAGRGGLWEVAGIPRPILHAFSTRRAEVEDRMAQRGETSRQAARVATLDTRRAKDYGVPVESLYDRWRSQADGLGFGRKHLAALLGRVAFARDVALDDATVARLLGPEGLTGQRSSFTRRDLLQAVAADLPRGTSARQVERVADGILRGPATVPLLGVPDPLTVTEARYSTPEMLAVERQVLIGAESRRHAGLAVADDAAVGDALARRPTLSGEQVAMVRRLVTSGAGVDVVVGKAGAGKTYALDAAREAWQNGGTPVIGAALAARAAAELEAGAGIRSVTLARLLADAERPPEAGGGLPRGGVLVVDEAGMVGTRTLARVLALAQRHDTKVVLVGDPRQLPEIDAGGAFRALAARLDAIVLAENRRQVEPWERAALDELRHGDVPAALAAYREHGRITTAETAPALRAAMVTDWWAAFNRRSPGEGEPVMLALRRADVADLNARARTHMLTAGRLGPALTVNTDDGGRTFAVGDVVVGLHNDYRHNLRNGARGTVTALHEDGSLTIRLADGSDAIAMPGYLAAGRLDHGYAMTVHKAQGMTTGRVFLLGSDELYREAGYVGLSRGQLDNRLYVVAPDPDPDVADTYHGPAATAPDARTGPAYAAVAAALGQSRAQHLAAGLAALPDPHLRALIRREARARETPAVPAVRGTLAALDGERAHLNRLAREQQQRADRLRRDRDNCRPWQRAERRALSDWLDIAQRALAATRERLDTLGGDIARLTPHAADSDRHDRATTLGRAAADELTRRHGHHTDRERETRKREQQQRDPERRRGFGIGGP